jgi:squalene-hopene/tetraprenyl-beta-curcumene cyclase
MLPLRKKGIARARDWILAHFEKSSGLGAIFPPMIYALLALRCLKYEDDHPEVVRARKELEALEIEDEETLRLQPCRSPVWDTAIIVNALTAAGFPPYNHKLIKTGKWLLSKEVRDLGDWSVKRPKLKPGGWYFEYENEFYPDIDDTAMVLLALRDLPVPSSDAICRAIEWVLAMQGTDGGWASFDVDNNRQLFCSIPFADHNAMIDPSTADVTGRVLEMLAAYGYDRSHEQVRKGIMFLLSQQEPDGSWFGRWGVNYIYGTCLVMRGLRAIGLPEGHPAIVRGAEWLLDCQNPDGGWGETCRTYDCPSEKGNGPSSASQTAWAVMGLVAAGHGSREAVQQGIAYLLDKQNADGSWDEDEWTGTGFPKVFYLKYHLYRQSFPLWALGVYARYLEEQGGKPA